MQAIGDARGIAQVMVVVEDRVGERRGHVSDLLGLCHEVQHTVFDKLQDVGHAVRTVQFHIALLLAHESLVALGLEEFPCTDEVLHHVDVRARLDVEVAGIEVATDVQTRDKLEGFVFRIRRSPLTMQVEVVALRRLQVALLKGFAMPGAIALGDVHVVHVDRHPHVGGGIGYLVVDMGIDQEIVGLRIAILDVIHTRFLHLREVELHIIIFKIGSPFLDSTLEGLLRRTVGLDAHQRGRGLHTVVLVEFDHSHLRLLGDIADLREADIGLADPIGDGMRLHRPGDHLTRLSLRQHAAQHEPAVLGEHTSVVELQLGIIAADADHARGVVGSHHQLMARLQGQRIHKTVGTTVVIGLEALELSGFLAIRTGDGLTGGITGESVQATIHQEGLQPILRRQELDVEARLASQFLRHGLIQVDGYLHSLTLGSDHHATVEVVVVVAHAHLDATLLAVHLAAGHLWHQVPLLRGVVQTHGTALYGTHTMVDDLNARVLLVVETAVETVAEHQHVDPLSLEILEVVKLQVLPHRRHRQQG